MIYEILMPGTYFAGPPNDGTNHPWILAIQTRRGMEVIALPDAGSYECCILKMTPSP